MYNDIVANHYAAYRPQLHGIILGRVFTEPHNSGLGLDIGCGTGQSSLALQKICPRVIGIDRSKSMLKKVSKQPGIEYVVSSGEEIPFADESFDVVTIAGSLNYLDQAKLVGELNRVCSLEARILVYDFEVVLDRIMAKLNLTGENDLSEYDHSMNLSANTDLEEVLVVDDLHWFDLDSIELAHLLLSESGLYETLQERYQARDFFDSLKNDIETINFGFQLQANIHYSMYLPR